MKANLRKLQKQRIYSEDFKREIMSLFESGKYSVLQLEKLYGISDSVIYCWVYKFSTFNEKGIRIVEMKESSTNKLKELEGKVRQLEQVVGQKQIQIVEGDFAYNNRRLSRDFIPFTLHQTPIFD